MDICIGKINVKRWLSSQDHMPTSSVPKVSQIRLFWQHMQAQIGIEVGCFHSTSEKSDKEWSGTWWARLGSVQRGELMDRPLMD
ncbi:hypothetical protein CesoFtcFv8_009900 [Champsocephalus esox]|uniref:Uncharacterized protein n=1 Tax=Champsocephalus esox TaxID=159716 RepID=A0AAN8C7U7_9TELE|nr:hypothetical protein CesoFtcFv8_009900 [Champsocephalus esox]